MIVNVHVPFGKVSVELFYSSEYPRTHIGHTSNLDLVNGTLGQALETGDEAEMSRSFDINRQLSFSNLSYCLHANISKTKMQKLNYWPMSQCLI